jgi:hypothetical protein
MFRTFAVLLVASAAIVSNAPAQQQDQANDKSATVLPKGKPGPGMVWVDAKSKIYYRQGQRLYGKTAQGTYMSEGDAVNGGYRDSTQNPPDTAKKAGSAKGQTSSSQ